MYLNKILINNYISRVFHARHKAETCCNQARFIFLSPSATNLDTKFYKQDSWTNTTPKIKSTVGKNIYLKQFHPLSLIRERIVHYFYSTFKGRTGNPIFSVHDQLNPVVSVEANFDSLLVPKDHPSRTKNDCYYLNKDYLLRAHMTAHQCELMRMGLNNFLMVGDVYRRDEIDSSHYPVFHQLDCVRLLTANELLKDYDNGMTDLQIFKTDLVRTNVTQEHYSEIATALAGQELRATLEGLCKELFGENVTYQWVDAYFPFTHPSWELEILLGDKWVEVLGCGIMEHGILQNGGCKDRIGWAFGIGLERLAMILYDIPDIRLFWSEDSGFLSQFANKSFTDSIKYVAVSSFPQCRNDLSFWIPKDFTSNDFYELVREVGGDIIEQVFLVDEFSNPKIGLTSHCYRIIYRHMERTLTKEEVNAVHKNIADKAVAVLNVKIR